MVNERGLIVKTFFRPYGHPQHLGKIDAVFLLCISKGGCLSLFTIHQNDVGARFDGDWKYRFEKGGDKLSKLKDAGKVSCKS
jgi:hypothetical protein